MIPEVLLELGERFTPDDYLFWSRIQGTLWTLADILIVYYLTHTVNAARAFLDAPRRAVPYAVLALTLPFAAAIPFVPSGRAFFMLEVAVTVPHFLIIVFLIVRDAPLVLEAIHRRANLPRFGSSEPAG